MSSKNGIDHRHCKWPLGTLVWVKTPQGYMEGRVNRHLTHPRYIDKCDIAFVELVDMGDANGVRYCHAVPFRNIKPKEKKVRSKRPWYKESPYDKVK